MGIVMGINKMLFRNTLNGALFALVALICSGCLEQSYGIKGATNTSTVASAQPSATPDLPPIHPPIIIPPILPPLLPPILPSPTVAPNPTNTPVPKPSATPVPTATPAPTATATPVPTATATPVPVACTETCSVSNGVGVQTCGQPSTCTLTKCNPGYAVVNGACVQAVAMSNFKCTSYEKLVLDVGNNHLNTATGNSIPAQDPSGQGVCYYYPLVVQTPALSGPSYLTGTSADHHDQDVIARDHDTNSGSLTTVWHPYSMAHANVNFMMAGARVLNVTGGSVSGNAFTTENVEIDNFFLVGVYPQSSALSTANLQSYYSAWGTGDSVISGGAPGANPTNVIAFNPAGLNLTTNSTNKYSDGTLGYYSTAGVVTSSAYSMISLTAEASGGTASVPEVSITNLITPNTNMTIDFRALDCGSGRALNSIYLLVQ